MFEILKLGDKEPIVYYVPNGGRGGGGIFLQKFKRREWLSDLWCCFAIPRCLRVIWRDETIMRHRAENQVERRKSWMVEGRKQWIVNEWSKEGRKEGRKDGWMDGCMDGWVDEWLDGWMDGWMMDGWMDGWNEWMDGWVAGWMNGWMDWWMGEWMDDMGGLMHWWMGGWVDGWAGGRVNRLVYGSVGGWYGLIDGADGWAYGQVDGWMDGSSRAFHKFLEIFEKVSRNFSKSCFFSLGSDAKICKLYSKN